MSRPSGDSPSPAAGTADAIRALVVQGQYAPGAQLKEEELAMRLGVSRTPVREALRRLQAEGLVEYRPNRGTFIPEWDERDRQEVFDLRLRLETYAAELAARRITPIQLEELRDMCQQMEEATVSTDPDRYDRISLVNNRFHRLLAAASGRPRLETMLTSLLNVPLMHRAFSTYQEEAVRRSNTHHRELVDALAAHDPDWAAAVTRAHVHVARNLLRAQAADGGQL